MSAYDRRARNELKALMVARGLSWKGDTRSNEDMVAALVEYDEVRQAHRGKRHVPPHTCRCADLVHNGPHLCCVCGKEFNHDL